MAAFGLRGALALGEWREVAGDPEGWRAVLSSLAVELRRDGGGGGPGPRGRGRGRDVLSGPWGTLRWLVDDLARHPEARPLAAGVVVTTGTLTAAHPVAPGQRWTPAITGALLRGLDLRLG